MFTRLFLILTIAGLFLGNPASASAAEGTLIFDEGSITLVNTGSAPLDIGPLLFVRDDAGHPVRFEARNWQVTALQPGDCVQLIAAEASARLPGECRRLVRWLLTARADLYFWRQGAAQDQFRVVAWTSELATCAIADGRCVFALDKAPRFETLILEYDAQSLRVVNDASSPASIARLTFCEPGSDGCTPFLVWQTPPTLDPGGCAGLITGAGAVPCSLSRAVPIAFWTQPFSVISPVTAHTMQCPAALPGKMQQCLIAR